MEEAACCPWRSDRPIGLDGKCAYDWASQHVSKASHGFSYRCKSDDLGKISVDAYLYYYFCMGVLDDKKAGRASEKHINSQVVKHFEGFSYRRGLNNFMEEYHGN